MFIQVGFCWGCSLLSFHSLVYPHCCRIIQIHLCLSLASLKKTPQNGRRSLLPVWFMNCSCFARAAHQTGQIYVRSSYLTSGASFLFVSTAWRCRGFCTADSSRFVGVVYLDGVFEAQFQFLSAPRPLPPVTNLHWSRHIPELRLCTCANKFFKAAAIVAAEVVRCRGDPPFVS